MLSDMKAWKFNPSLSLFCEAILWKILAALNLYGLHRKSLVRNLTWGFYFFFAFSFFCIGVGVDQTWTDLGQSKPMIGQTAVMELTKNCLFYSRFIKIFSWIFFLSIFTTWTDGISLEVFYAYWKVIGFAIPSTIAALLFFLQFLWAITDNFILTNLEIE